MTELELLLEQQFNLKCTNILLLYITFVAQSDISINSTAVAIMEILIIID